MFEAAELGQKVAKADYREQVPELRLELLRYQMQLRDADFPVIVVLAGDDPGGCSETLNLLQEWLDPRFVQGIAFGRKSDEEEERPTFWRYWRRLPANGRIGVFLGGWATEGLLRRLGGAIDDAGLERWSEHVRRFEQGLADDGAVVIKFWLHVPKDELKRRLKAAKKNPDQLWFHQREHEWVYKNYDEGLDLAERVLRRTSTGKSPWHVVESTDSRSRNLTVARQLLKAISKQLASPDVDAAQRTIEIARPGLEAERTVLDNVDLSQSLDKERYEKALKKGQSRLAKLTRRALVEGVSSVLVFEGWDAAGKGGVVRRLTAAMDAPLYRVVPIAAPTDEERAHHYLWRFWRHLPRRGDVTIFDRSWYGRVLVERVEGFAFSPEWARAYEEIRDFEEQLVEHNVVVLKFWLHVSKDEQLARFKAREETPHKKFKITQEDYRNRERWRDYELAVNEMVLRTSTRSAPWTIVPANDKRFARVMVLNEFCEHLEKALG